ncbi:nicotinate-nucleotide adenylyltransferase [Bryocella elongata]|uniref:Probable nicotinate-nucleotide adenylyltransferase n=1 Tax=Bryocella elongata TaxID=863522 RepID=A0A1H5XZY6_9BACT|nr:nicotinate (nicotinamide) nucleotide adenylyltransferase [Bryocella elongata]SEG17233.1 nicotinate-nucleotide adenylyltransferase [Bryocella elongata]
MRVGYFGGTFDPPHRGHLAVACAARDAFSLDLVLLAPTGKQPLKPDARSAPFADRLAMVELLCEGEVGLEASAIDAPRPDGSPNYTIDTLDRLRATLGSTEASAARLELFVVVGADAFLSLPLWHRPEGLLRAAEWIVVSRPGFSREDLRSVALPEDDAERVHLLESVDVPISATDVRSQLLAGERRLESLTPGVLAYIEARHLYGR